MKDHTQRKHLSSYKCKFTCVESPNRCARIANSIPLCSFTSKAQKQWCRQAVRRSERCWLASSCCVLGAARVGGMAHAGSACPFIIIVLLPCYPSAQSLLGLHLGLAFSSPTAKLNIASNSCTKMLIIIVEDMGPQNVMSGFLCPEFLSVSKSLL